MILRNRTSVSEIVKPRRRAGIFPALLAATCFTATSMFPISAAFAQDAENTGTAPSELAEEILVMARKKAESLQTVPVAVSAVTGADLEKSFLVSTTGLAQFAPNVIFDTVESGAASPQGFSIRGISYQDVEKAFDPTVLVSVDGVVNATGTGNVFSLLDIDRIEVLRGPQGTLFGKNAVGGIINIYRTKPQLGQLSGKLRGRFGKFERADVEGLLNYGEDTWAVKLTAASLNQGKGYTKNAAGTEFDKTDTLQAGVHFLWAPTDDFTAEIQYNYSKLSGLPGATVDISTDSSDVFCAFNPCNGILGEPYTGNRRITASNFPGAVGIKKHSITSEINYDINSDFTFTYIGNWMRFTDRWEGDSDGSALDLISVLRDGDYEQSSHELRIARDAGDAFSAQAGVYFFENSSTTNHRVFQPILSGSSIPSPLEITDAKSNSLSIFGEGDLKTLDDKLIFTLGGRYIRETKQIGRTVIDLLTTPNQYLVGPNAGGERTDDEFIYRAGVRYQFTPDLMLYFTNSTGFRSGGFSPRASTLELLSEGFGPEKLINYEVGLRTQFWDRRATFNLTAFHMDYKNMQIEVSLPEDNLVSQIAIKNVGQAKFDGVEADFRFNVADFWRIGGNAGYLRARYTDFTADIYGDGVVADETGLKLRRAPKWTFALQSDVTLPVGNGEINWHVGYNWTDSYEGTLTNAPGTRIKAFGLLDSSLSYDVGNWTVSLYGRNLTNSDAYTHTYSVGPGRPSELNPLGGSVWKFALVRPPRDYGLEVTFRF